MLGFVPFLGGVQGQTEKINFIKNAFARWKGYDNWDAFEAAQRFKKSIDWVSALAANRFLVTQLDVRNIVQMSPAKASSVVMLWMLAQVRLGLMLDPKRGRCGDAVSQLVLETIRRGYEMMQSRGDIGFSTFVSQCLRWLDAYGATFVEQGSEKATETEALMLNSVNLMSRILAQLDVSKGDDFLNDPSVFSDCLTD